MTLLERNMKAGDGTNHCVSRSGSLAMEISFQEGAVKDEDPKTKPTNLQAAFLEFRQKRQREMQQAKEMEKKAMESRCDSKKMSKLRQKFLDQAKAYFGVPYAKRYHKPGTAFHDSPLFLDCCGLVRQVLRDLKEDFGFVIGSWNQAYMYDLLPIVIDKEEDMKPGDLVFISGTYFNPKSKAQRHDMVHVEIWLGEGQKTIGARWQKGVVQIHDSYQFEAKSYHSMQYHFRSIDTWLTGVCKSYCPQHTWKKSQFIPGQKSVFALLLEQDTYSQDQPAEGEEDTEDEPAEHEEEIMMAEDQPAEHEEDTVDTEQEIMVHEDRADELANDEETVADEDCQAKHEQETADNKGKTRCPHFRSFCVSKSQPAEVRPANHEDRSVNHEGGFVNYEDLPINHEDLPVNHEGGIVNYEEDSVSYVEQTLKYGSTLNYQDDTRTYREDTAEYDNNTVDYEDSPATCREDIVDHEDDFVDFEDDTINHKDIVFSHEEKPENYEDVVDIMIYEDKTINCEEDKGSSVNNEQGTPSEEVPSNSVNGVVNADDITVDIPRGDLAAVGKKNPCSETEEQLSVIQESGIISAQLPSSEGRHVEPVTLVCHPSFSSSKFLDCVQHHKDEWESSVMTCPSSNDTKGSKSRTTVSPRKPSAEGRGRYSRSGRFSNNGQDENSEKRQNRRPVRVKAAPVLAAASHQPTFFLGGGNGNWMIEETLVSLGWKRVEDKNDESFTLKWVECKGQINYNTFREGSQLVNHISNIGLLTTKMGLLSSLQEHLRIVEKTLSKAQIPLNDFLPESYRLGSSAEKTKFVHQIYKEGDVWICKPTGLNQGKGIYLVNNKQQLMEKLGMNTESRQVSTRRRNISRPPQGRIIQRYVANPLLLNGCKFDVRAYMLIASTRPYLVFYHPGYVRLSCVPYTPYSSDSAQGLHAHLTNQFVQKMHPLYSSLKEETVWSFDRLQTYIDENVRKQKDLPENWVRDAFEKRMQQIMLLCFESVRQKLHRRVGYFDLLGFDFMVDENLKVWLLEINVNPALHTNCQVLMERIPGIVDETLKLVIEIFEKTKKKRQVLPLQELREFRILYNGEGKRSPLVTAWVT